MIIENLERKVPHVNSADGRFASSIVYVAPANCGAFGPSICYAIEGKSDLASTLDGERVLQIWSNDITSIETAPIEMELVARLCKTTDPVSHFVIAYDTARGEMPTTEQMHADVERVLRERCFTDGQKHLTGKRGKMTPEELMARIQQARTGVLSQYVAVVHGDTDNLHIHVIVNRVARNGVLNGDFRSKIVNEHIAATIASERGWEIVVGRFNAHKVAEQAKQRGATQSEIEALQRREGATLDRVRENAQAAARTTAEEQAMTQRGRSRNVEFRIDYAQRIAAAFELSDSYKAFEAALAEDGVRVKFWTDKGKNGASYHKLSFATIDDRAGASGTSVGLTAKHLIAKYPDSAPGPRDRGGANPARKSGEPVATKQPEQIQSKPREPLQPAMENAEGLAAQPLIFSVHDDALRNLAAQLSAESWAKSIAEIARQNKLTSKILDVYERVGEVLGLFKYRGGFAPLRVMRELRQKRIKARTIELKNANNRATALTKALQRIEADREYVLSQLAAAPDWKKERLDEQLAAIDLRAQYEIARDAEIEKERQRRDTEWRRLFNTHTTDVNVCIDAARAKSAFRKGMHELTFPNKGDRWTFEKTLRQRLKECVMEIRKLGKLAWAGKAALLKEAGKQSRPLRFEEWLREQASKNPESAEIRAATAHMERQSKFKAGLQRSQGVKPNIPAPSYEQRRAAPDAPPIGRSVVGAPAPGKPTLAAVPVLAALEPQPCRTFVFDVEGSLKRIRGQEAVEETARQLTDEQAEPAGVSKIEPEQSPSKFREKSPAAAHAKRETEVSTPRRSRDSQER